MASPASSNAFALPANHGLADKPTALAVEAWHATTAPADCASTVEIRVTQPSDLVFAELPYRRRQLHMVRGSIVRSVLRRAGRFACSNRLAFALSRSSLRSTAMSSLLSSARTLRSTATCRIRIPATRPSILRTSRRSAVTVDWVCDALRGSGSVLIAQLTSRFATSRPAATDDWPDRLRF